MNIHLIYQLYVLMFTKAEVGCGMSSDPLEDSSEGKGETTAWQDSEGFLT
jgi:hypothetical protein